MVWVRKGWWWFSWGFVLFCFWRGQGRGRAGEGRTPKPVTRMVRSLVVGGGVGEGPWEPIVLFGFACLVVVACVGLTGSWREGCRVGGERKRGSR